MGRDTERGMQAPVGGDKRSRASPRAVVGLAWLLHQGDDVAPIPGTKRIRYLEENAAAVEVELSDEQLATLNETFSPGVASGDRYAPAGMATVEQ